MFVTHENGKTEHVFYVKFSILYITTCICILHRPTESIHFGVCQHTMVIIDVISFVYFCFLTIIVTMEQHKCSATSRHNKLAQICCIHMNIKITLYIELHIYLLIYYPTISTQYKQVTFSIFKSLFLVSRTVMVYAEKKYIYACITICHREISFLPGE